MYKSNKIRSFFSFRSLWAKGFLLFEAMVAISILSFGLVFILRTLSSSLQTLRVSENYIQALLIAEEKMWELEEESRRGGIDPIHTRGKFNVKKNTFEWELYVAELEDMDIVHMNKVELIVEWKEKQRERTISLVTYLRNKEEE